MVTAARPSESAIAMTARAMSSSVKAGRGPRLGPGGGPHNSLSISRHLKGLPCQRNCVYRKQHPRDTVTGGTRMSGKLSGFRVLVSGAGIAGPALACRLADAGAETT